MFRHLFSRTLPLLAALACLSGLLLSSSAHAAPQPGSRCNSKLDDGDALVRACNQLIASGSLRGAALAQAHAERARGWALKGDYARAIPDLDSALALRPGQAAYLSLRGTFKYQNHDFPGALGDYSAALAITPDGDSYANRGVTYLELNDYPAALQDFRRALELRPGSPDYLLRRGLAWRGMGQYERAVEDYAGAITGMPAPAGAPAQTWCDYGIDLFYSGRFDEAVGPLGRCPREDTENYPYMVIWQYVARMRALGPEAPATAGAARAPAAIARERATRAFAEDPALTSAWPGPVRDLLLGRITPEALQALSATLPATKSEERPCELAFYIGIYHMLRQDPGAARPYFTSELPQCGHALLEYHGAVAELKRMRE